MKGIDISTWQKGFNLKNALNNGYEFAILRAGFTGWGGDGTGKNKDDQFENFYNQAKTLNMPIGAYWYSCANNYDKGVSEANFMYENCLKGKKFEYPIYIDVEENRWQSKDKKGVTDAIIGFCKTLEAKGYFVGIYASLSWFNTKIDTNRLNAYTKWVACWNSTKPDFKYNAFDLWQNSSDGNIAGTRIDTNYAYRDFPSIIKNGGFNGYSKTSQSETKKSIDEIAREVIEGKWSNGATRKQKLVAAGYNYNEVQNRVNEMLGSKNKKSIDEIAREVIKGDWGNGQERKKRLTNAGYDYNIIQTRVNQILGK